MLRIAGLPIAYEELGAGPPVLLGSARAGRTGTGDGRGSPGVAGAGTGGPPRSGRADGVSPARPPSPTPPFPRPSIVHEPLCAHLESAHLMINTSTLARGLSTVTPTSSG